MKKILLTIVAMLTMTLATNAMSYEQARNQALFLTDKMAYELNLTDAQYEAAYEINLDYLMGVTSYDDVYGTYWERRNLDLSYILLDWQWNAFRAATYFYRPLYWRDGFWHFGIYARHPRRDYFYFGRPVFYASYRGGHSWHSNGGRSYYYGRRDHFHTPHHTGMRDGWNRGDYRDGNDRFGSRNSSTRTTVNNGNYNSGNYNNGNNNSGSYNNGSMSRGNSTSSTSSLGTARSSGSFGSRSTSSGTFSSPVSPGTTQRSAVSSGTMRSSTPATRSSGSFGGNSSTIRSSGSFGSRSGGSFSGGSSVTRSSGSSNSNSNSGGGARSGGSFGRR